ncbi:uncharacterized protein LOC6561159 [Drosophila grimshawi]|uniref:GH19777 n=1 Tax=Drosophila grimshawi TaxID=7222 RepID=B4J426_DROGR|nr:uncharacterized protein LOC6561159 [Drosophila grimshawi]EDW02632.1 GH19777 [Drosophila grimshawi]
MYKYSYALLTLLVGLLIVTHVLARDAEDDAVEAQNANSLTAEQCGKKRSGCCSELYIGDLDWLSKCLSMHANKMPAEIEADMGKTFKFLSCFVECVYKQRKYIGKSDTINMKMVKLDAETLYADRPKEQEYHIKILDFCRKDAITKYNLIKFAPGFKAIVKNACRPFLMMVFLCQAEYHMKQECPYFRWESNDKSGGKEMCKDARAKCYEIDGITLNQ